MQRSILLAALAAGLVASGPALAGGVLLYEIGTAEVGLASAGYGARAQDASTAFTNPAGMTRLDGTQVLGGGQLIWLNNKFSIGGDTSPALGNDAGGSALGWGGFVPGGGAFVSHSVSNDLKLGFSFAGNFGSKVGYDDDWVGRYRIQSATMLGMSLVPSIAYRVGGGLSVGAGVNAMLGIYNQQVAINNVLPNQGDGQLKMSDTTWGWGGNVGLMYEVSPATRFGLTWNSQVNLDFAAPAEFSGLGPGLRTLLASRGLLDSTIKVGVKVPQQVMASAFSQVDDRWAVMGNVGWQQWSRFGDVALGIEDTTNPRSLTASLPFKDTWHVAAGAQYRMSEPWLLNFGVAYDSAFQDGSNVSPLLPVNAAWRFGVGGEKQENPTFKWGVAGEFLWGGTIDVDSRANLPVALGGRGDLVGSYNDTASIVMTVYANWKF